MALKEKSVIKSGRKSGGKSKVKSLSRSNDKSLNKLSRTPRSNKTTDSASNTSLNTIVVMGNKKVIMTAEIVKMMRVLQKSMKETIPKLPFFLLVQKITQTYGEFRWNLDALNGLQAALDLYLRHLFEDSYKATILSKRVTLRPSDIKEVLMLRRRTRRMK